MQFAVTVDRLIFLSTLSLRRATCQLMVRSFISRISIHALLAESDKILLACCAPPYNFYPRSPCGERQNKGAMMVSDVIFLSTLSLRRATVSDKSSFIKELFLSTLSLRRATEAVAMVRWTLPISIHALLAESDDQFLRF